VHEDEFNVFFKANPHLKNLDFIEAAFNYLGVKLKIEGIENLPPKNGRYIFASNHPLGGLDGIATGYLIGKQYDGKVRFFSNDLMMNLHPMRDMFVPVNKTGAQSKEHAEQMQQLYESDNHLVTYPAGICSRKVRGKIVDLEWKKNFISKSIQYHRDIVPIYFEGKNSNFFYNLANIRKFLHIKINIEMLYLVDEMFKQKGNEFTIRIGKPIKWETIDKSKSQSEWAEHIKKIVYSMERN
jgi:putative hemolysin